MTENAPDAFALSNAALFTVPSMFGLQTLLAMYRLKVILVYLIPNRMQRALLSQETVDRTNWIRLQATDPMSLILTPVDQMKFILEPACNRTHFKSFAVLKLDAYKTLKSGGLQ